MTGNITFYVEGVDFKVSDPIRTRQWIRRVAEQAGYPFASLTYIFVSDEYLLNLNREVLQHDYYTDIITFPYHSPGQPIEAEMYISIDRVADNAQELGETFEDELNRVMIHGLLHMMGYNDETDDEEAAMRAAEDTALALRQPTSGQ